MAAASSLPPPRADGSTVRAASWVLYDLANTVYAATLTYLFTPYCKQVLGDLRAFGLVSFASMVLAGLAVPVLGVWIDQTARTQRYLTVATLACIVAMAGFAADTSAAWLLGCFFVANVGYNVGLLFYNALLPAVAAPGREGRLSGLGTGLGYFGTILVLMSLKVVPGTTTRFVVAAAMFLIGALPCMALVKDRRQPHAPHEPRPLRAAFERLFATLRELRHHRALRWFLLGNFCLVDVLNTAILYFADFTRSVFHDAAHGGSGARLLGWSFVGEAGLDDLILVLGLWLNGLALVAGLVQGAWTDRAPLTVMRASAVALGLALVGGTLCGGTSVAGYLLTLGACGAFGLSGVWTAGRKVIVLLAPPERVGEFFGLYGVTVKLSVIGSAVYGFVEHLAGAKPAMLAQGVQLLIGLLCLAMVRVGDDARTRR